jgi:hypothetical protein
MADMFPLTFLYPHILHPKYLIINYVEARGVEPLSSSLSTQTSTCLSGDKF